MNNLNANQTNYEVTPVRRLMSDAVLHHEIRPRNDIISPQDFLNEIRETVISYNRGKPQNKIQLSLICEMMRTDPVTGNIVAVEKFAFNSYQKPIYDSTHLEATYERMVAKILESFLAFLKNGSGWTLKRIIKLDITPAKNKPVKGSSYVSLPEVLRRKNMLINMKNEDNECFKWAVTRALNLVVKNAEGITKDLKKQAEELNWDGTEFQTPCSERMYKKIERNNNVSLLVFGHEDTETGINIIPLYVPKERRGKTIRLFFLNDGENSHYCVINSMSRLISSQVSKNTRTKYVCDYCLNYFGSQKVLDKHTESCSKHEAVNTILPKPGENIFKFKNIQNCVECPIKFYADSILPNIDETHGKTKLHQRHVMSVFCFYPVFRVEGFSMEHVTYVIKDEHDEVDKIFMENLEEAARKVYETFKTPVPMIFDEDAMKLHESLTVCYACGDKLGRNKVRDNCHYTGKYRGTLNSKCNLKLKVNRTIPVLFHDLSGYDSHLFVKRLADTDGEVDCIPENEEKYITFNKNVLVDTIERDGKKVKVYVRLKFLDTFRFMNTSLAKLVKNIDRFEHTDKYFTTEQQELLRRKEVYPYNYMTNFSKSAETELPPKEAFNTCLDSGTVSCSDEFDEMKPKEIFDEDYEHRQKVFKDFVCENLGDYTGLYVRTDTFQLADVMENFIDVCLEKYKLGPVHYVTAAALAWDGMLKVTGVEIELLTDPNMYLFFEEGIRGGASSAMKRYLKANNKYMKDYDPEKPSVFIPYQDKNGLYTSVLRGPLPHSGFRWLTE